MTRGWCDVGMCLEGPLVHEFAVSFDEMFTRADFQHKRFVRLRKALLRRATPRSEEQALKDPLTGLANPRALQFQVTRELARARRTSTPFSVVLLDLDDFKIINDEYGHLAGDRALQAVAKVLQETTRSYDTCIRYGGDEFVVLLSSCGRAEAEERRQRLQEAVAAISLRADDGRGIALRVSAGASVFPEDGDTYERLLVRADRRMYRNKAASKSPLLFGRRGRADVVAMSGT